MFIRLLLPVLLLGMLWLDATAQNSKFDLPRRAGALQGKPGVILVKVQADLFEQGVTPETFGELARRYGVYNIRSWINPALISFRLPAYKRNGAVESPTLALRRILLVEYSSLDSPEEVALAIGSAKGVEYAEPIYSRTLLYTPNDPELTKQWYLDAVHAREAWDIVRGDSSIIIAITDTGIERLHPDLKDAIWYNPGETGPDGNGGDKSTNGIDDDGNGYVDDWWGYDFGGHDGSATDNDPSPGDEDHGTFVAGITAASGNNGEGIAGIAFGAKLMAVKIADDRTLSQTDLYREAEAILYAAKMGANVINASWGGQGAIRAEQEVINAVIQDYDVVIVSAAGNLNSEVDFYPASYNGVLSIAAITEGSARADFSNYGYRIDLSAPGTSIYSTTLTTSGTYAYDNGTSFSTPIVSAAAALVRLRYPHMSAGQIREALIATTDDISGELGSAYAPKMGSGRLNIRHAVESAHMQVAARMVSFAFLDADGNGIIDAGENVRLRTDIRNLLAPAAQVSVSVTAVDGATVDLQSASVNLGAMASDEARSTPDGTITFTVPVGTPENSEIRFKVVVEADGRPTTQFITLRVVPSYLTTDLNDISATFNSIGNIGYNGVNHNQGDGFAYKGDNYLYHGGLIIATDATHMADVVKESNTTAATGLRSTSPYRLVTADDSSVQIGTARFSDAHLDDSRRVGVDVEMNTYEYREHPATVIVVYKIRNTSGHKLSDLRTGLYLDWDVSRTGFSDQTGYDPENRLGYMRAPMDPSRPYVGTALLNPIEASFYGVDNSADHVHSFFTQAVKWMMLSSGIHENTKITDMGMVLGAGPLTLEPDQTTEVAYAMTIADDFQGLRESVVRARSLYQPGSVVPPPITSTGSVVAAPNPFGRGTALSFIMPERGTARLTVYNLRGEQVGMPLNTVLEAGPQQTIFSADDLPDGVYFYQLQTAGTVQQGTLVKSGR